MALFAACVGALGVLAGCQPAAVEAQPNPAATSELIYPAKTSPFALGEGNFVTHWLVLGPIKFNAADFKGDQQQDATDHEFMKDEAALDGTQPAPKGATWQAKHFKPAAEGQAGQIDLNGLYGDPEYAVAYAVAWVTCQKDLDALKLCVGSDDYVRVWINGKCVHTYKAKRRASEWDQDVIAGVSLKKGPNRIVVKCVDVVFAWDFYLRLADAKDKAVQFKGPAAK
jgi:hypothetical protein